MKKILLALFTTFLLFISCLGLVFAQLPCPGFIPKATPCPSGCQDSYAPGDAVHNCSGFISTNNEGRITNPALNANVGTGEGETILAKILAAVINLFFIAGSIAVLVYLLMGGLAWITSEGDKGKLEIARSRLTSAVFGIVVIAAAYAILRLIGGFLGINFFTDLIIKWPTITQ